MSQQIKPVTPTVSVIIPVFNEADVIKDALLTLQAERSQGLEIIVVDGGSSDSTAEQAKTLADKIITSAPGRARQMNAGASLAQGDWLAFLHVDTRLDENLTGVLGSLPSGWGFFRPRLSGRHPMFRVIEFCMAWRSRLSSVGTGDQLLFFHRDCWAQLGGFTDIPLMEDIDICKRARRIMRPCCRQERVVTSSRRWEQQGIVKTILLMWRLRLAFWLGVSPSRLHRSYRTNVR